MATSRFAASALTILSAVAAIPAAAEITTRAQYLMGTVLEIKVTGEDRASSGRAISAAFAEVARLEEVMSTYRVDSELSRLNRSAPESFACSKDLFSVLAAAMNYADATVGAFTPTMHPLIMAWGRERYALAPEEGLLRTAFRLSRQDRLHLEPRTRTARLVESGAGVNLGAIGKGFALDRAGEELRRRGVAAALLNFGGQILALGAPAGATSWEVEIADPAGGGTFQRRVFLKDESASTSGAFRRELSGSGIRFPHVIDPRTGRPVARRGSVTVIAPTAIEADAISTALLVMGRERAREYIIRNRHLRMHWIAAAESGRGSLEVSVR